MKILSLVALFLGTLFVLGGVSGYEYAQYGKQKQLLMHEDLAWRYAYADGTYDSFVLHGLQDEILPTACPHFKQNEEDRAAMPDFDTKHVIYNYTKELREACENPYSIS